MRLVVILAVLVSMSGCRAAIQDAVVKHQLKKAQTLLRDEGNALEPVGGPVWSWKFGWYRNLVLVSGEEIAVVDPMSEEAAAALATELAAKFPGKRITLIVYSHSHHDHIRGAAKLPGNGRIVAHENVVRELALVGSPADVLAPTATVAGDHTLTWAGITIELLHLPRSHSDAYLAVWLPEQKVLYAPDLAFKKGGLLFENDNFMPGVIRGQERLLALGAETIVPGHFALCTNADLKRNLHTYVRAREIARQEILKEKTWDATKMSPETFLQIQHRLVEELGDVEGFEDASLINTNYLVLGAIGGF